jgi:hypothetical protein
MLSAVDERGKEIGNHPAGNAEQQENAKKMLNSGNELKDLLKTQHLAVFRAKNELKTNPKRTQFCAQKMPIEPPKTVAASSSPHPAASSRLCLELSLTPGALPPRLTSLDANAPFAERKLKTQAWESVTISPRGTEALRQAIASDPRRLRTSVLQSPLTTRKDDR